MKYLVSMVALASLMLPAIGANADSGKIDKKILGAWKLQLTLPDGNQKDAFVLLGRQYDRYCAWRVSKEGLEPFQDIKMDGDVLSGTIKPKDAPGVTVTLQAQPDGKGACKGTARYETEDGDSGKFHFSGKQIDLTTLDDVSRWELNFVSPDYETHKAIVTVIEHGDHLHAWYSGKDHDIPVSKITAEGNQVTMKVIARTEDGRKVEVTFRGSGDDDSVSGTAEYKLDGDTGTFSFTGKRVS